MNCNKCQVCDEAWDALPVQVQEACEPDHAGDLAHAIGLLRRKAAFFDWLARHEHVWLDKRLTVFDDAGRDLFYHAPTLAEAVTAALAAESEGK